MLRFGHFPLFTSNLLRPQQATEAAPFAPSMKLPADITELGEKCINIREISLSDTLIGSSETWGLMLGVSLLYSAIWLVGSSRIEPAACHHLLHG